MTSQLDICNRALLAIGARTTVSSIIPPDGSQESLACATLFQPTFGWLARSAQWNCLRKQQILSVAAAAYGTPENPDGTSLPLPPSPWLYAYQYPSDCIALRSLDNSYIRPAAYAASVVQGMPVVAPRIHGNDGQIRFVVSSGVDANGNPTLVILANESQAQGVYTFNQSNPQLWDFDFQEAMVASLAARLVPALSLDMALMQNAERIVSAMIAEAQRDDANETVTVMEQIPDWIRARNCGARRWLYDDDGASWGKNSLPQG
jgi:hypothetical protein